MLIDCDSCEARGPTCDDCVVTVLLGAPAGAVELGSDEHRAIGVLAASGLVPPLRLLVSGAEPATAPADGSAPQRRDDARRAVG